MRMSVHAFVCIGKRRGRPLQFPPALPRAVPPSVPPSLGLSRRGRPRRSLAGGYSWLEMCARARRDLAGAGDRLDELVGAPGLRAGGAAGGGRRDSAYAGACGGGGAECCPNKRLEKMGNREGGSPRTSPLARPDSSSERTSRSWRSICPEREYCWMEIKLQQDENDVR